MCGIAGLILHRQDFDWRGALEFFSQGLAHRGPDDVGFLLSNGTDTVKSRKIVPIGGIRVGLVHRRLSIIDLSDMGWQPMATPDERYYIVFNGEIYNYLELRADLKNRGHIFRGTSDTEVLLAAWAEWGPSCLYRLVGMFAFAVLDIRDDVLYLVRDFFGIKPLYFAHFRGGLAFASEIPPLLNLPGVSRRVNPARLYRYLCFGLTDDGDETIFADISQVPAGHYLEVRLADPEQTKLKCYWRFDYQGQTDLSFKEAAARFRELFLESVRLHLRSDVSIGIALSGGIDSSSIAAAVRYLEPDIDLHAFSFVVKDDAISEERYLEIAARSTGAFVHTVQVAPEELIVDLDHLIRAQGEPFGSTSIYAQYRVFRLAHEMGIKVMLSGQGADELLAGYISYGGDRVASLVTAGKWGEDLNLLWGLSRLPGRERTWMWAVAALLPADLYPMARKIVGKSLTPYWLNRTWFAERGVDPQPPSRLPAWSKDLLRRRLLETLTETSLPMLLRYEDRNSMVYSVESRVPFLTPDLVNFAFHLPEEYLISKNGVSKSVFRAAMQGLVPDIILNRRDKIGFATPEKRWLQALNLWVEQEIGGQALNQIPVLRSEAVLQELRSALRGKRHFDSQIWRWINLIAWTRIFEAEYS
jgi:asparagine synthase (glutamine-hydrolysing)